MNGTAGPLLRQVRGAVLAFVVMSTGVVAHVTADGLLPSIPGLVAIYVGCAVGFSWLLSRPATATRIVLLTIGGQTLVHAVLTMSSGHVGDAPATSTTAAPPPPPVPTGTSGSLMEQYEASRPQVDAQLAVPEGVQHLFHDMTGAHAPMMALHLAAAAVVGLWLAVGERALWTLVALAATVVIPALGALLAGLRLPAPTPAVPAALARSAPAHLSALARSVVRRGPPALLPT
ncbi:hypothetical protein ncot_12195 [Nocardioides sp. JQ2195]|uniref:hypothetical protein n=1 Tax=Nocardioides sp. JQ2195 TaxID=2592334 RepID=UPI00143E8B3A|nr:hypothetical protein [Nocardioides sp. JQ2195]QIX27275.1 hypothetical protein ncot_12195 [Nocardioides sp. JQ2195]